MMIRVIVTGLVSCIVCSLAIGGHSKTDSLETKLGDVTFYAVKHGTLVITWNKFTVYVDPVGGAECFKDFPSPNLILITHHHGDHLHVDTLRGVLKGSSKIVAPKAVMAKLPKNLQNRATVLSNGENATVADLPIEAVAMYNVANQRKHFHPKGMGNGYILTFANKRVYISGDTGNTAELRALKEIDVAFLSMNLPYTMDVKVAAEAIRAFKPKIIYPYHFRNQDGTLADMEELKKLLSDEAVIQVRVLGWY